MQAIRLFDCQMIYTFIYIHIKEAKTECSAAHVHLVYRLHTMITVFFSLTCMAKPRIVEYAGHALN